MRAVDYRLCSAGSNNFVQSDRTSQGTCYGIPRQILGANGQCSQCGSSDITGADNNSDGYASGAISTLGLSGLSQSGTTSDIDVKNDSQQPSSLRAFDAHTDVVAGNSQKCGHAGKRVSQCSNWASVYMYSVVAHNLSLQIKGLTFGARKRPSTAPLPPLLQLSSTNQTRSDFVEHSITADNRPATGLSHFSNRRRRRRSWNSPYVRRKVDLRAPAQQPSTVDLCSLYCS